MGLSLVEEPIIKIGRVEILYPGVAFEPGDNPAGIVVTTNLTVEDLNNREKGCLFKSERAVWAFALRVKDRG